MFFLSPGVTNPPSCQQASPPEQSAAPNEHQGDPPVWESTQPHTHTCICTHTTTHVHTRLHTYNRTGSHARAFTHADTQTHSHAHTCVHARTHASTHLCTNTHTNTAKEGNARGSGVNCTDLHHLHRVWRMDVLIRTLHKHCLSHTVEATRDVTVSFIARKAGN